MIKINRPSQPPDILQKTGQEKMREHCESYDQNPEPYQRPRPKGKNFKFNRRVLSHSYVKSTLFEAQHKKCCYCERKIPQVSGGSLEHFRPKGSAKQSKEEPEEYPGYYWLAYCWDNLLFSCCRCNNRKGSLFPLDDPKQRARNHHDDVDAESPLFVDPARDDPRQHIRFRGAIAVPLTEKGHQTIKGMDLQRSRLRENRMQHLEHLRTFHFALIHKDAMGITRDESASMRQQVEAAMRPDAKYSVMMMDFLLWNTEKHMK